MLDKPRCGVQNPGEVVRRVERVRTDLTLLRDFPGLRESPMGAYLSERAVRRAGRLVRQLNRAWLTFFLLSLLTLVLEESPLS